MSRLNGVRRANGIILRCDFVRPGVRRRRDLSERGLQLFETLAQGQSIHAGYPRIEPNRVGALIASRFEGDVAALRGIDATSAIAEEVGEVAASVVVIVHRKDSEDGPAQLPGPPSERRSGSKKWERPALLGFRWNGDKLG